MADLPRASKSAQGEDAPAAKPLRQTIPPAREAGEG